MEKCNFLSIVVSFVRNVSLLTYLPLENWFGWQRYLRSRKDNPSMVDI